MSEVPEAFRCRCARFVAEAACSTRMTQEDMLCDVCRDGCNASLGDAGHAVHFAMAGESFSFTVTP